MQHLPGLPDSRWLREQTAHLCAQTQAFNAAAAEGGQLKATIAQSLLIQEPGRTDKKYFAVRLPLLQSTG